MLTVAAVAGGRADVQLTMPDHPVRVDASGQSYLLSLAGKSTVDSGAPGPEP